MLGNGNTSDSGYAKQVMADASTAFANAAEVTVGQLSTCARKTDGTVWCWGDNSSAELGSGSTSPAQSVYPVQVPILGNATQLMQRADSTHCAVIEGGTVTCWGQNPDNAAGTPGTATVGPPTTIKLASGSDAGGPDLQGVISLAPDRNAYTICASSTSSGLVCWGLSVQTPGGTAAASPYASVVYDPGTSAPVLGVTALSGDGAFNLVYLNPYGQLVIGAGSTPLSMQPPCN